MIKQMLDSVILIDHLNGIEKSTRFILGLNPDEIAISVITWAEVLVGIEERSEEETVRAFLDQYHLLVIDKPIAELAANLRKIHGWKLPDSFQAALAIYHKIKLCTRDTKDFNPEQHDFVEIPYRL